MHSRKPSYLIHKLRVGFSLYCPSCERGRLFESRFRVHETCKYCGCRFNRHSGDSIGGIYFNIALAELTALIGFVVIHLVFEPPIIHQLPFWLAYILLFTSLFYRYARGIWLSVMYITGNIYPDLDVDGEYIASETIMVGRTPQEFE
jgi:uncharacterized protein (DUF983 family)